MQEYTFKSKGLVDIIADRIYISPLLYLTQTSNTFKADTRNYPIHFNYPMQDKYCFTINIPDGYEVESLPKGLAVV